jgi:hypothetical protein
MRCGRRQPNASAGPVRSVRVRGFANARRSPGPSMPRCGQ